MASFVLDSARTERGQRALALLVSLLSSKAFACAVCGAGENDPSRGSYVWMSVIISLLPLAMIGGVVGWLVVKARAADREEAAAVPAESAKS